MSEHVAQATYPGRELEALELERDQLVERLTRVCRDPSFDSVEGIEFSDWRKASVAKGELTDLLIHAIDEKNAGIRTLIAYDGHSPVSLRREMGVVDGAI